jgi:hypothetical protein
MLSDKPVGGPLDSNADPDSSRSSSSIGGSSPQPPRSSSEHSEIKPQASGVRSTPETPRHVGKAGQEPAKAEKAKRQEKLQESERDFKVKHLGLVGVLVWIL